MSPTNRAVWLLAKNAGKFEIRSAPYPSPKSNEIVIQNRTIAVNPVDWILPLKGSIMFAWLKYPFIIGTDVSGSVTAVGPGVTDFQIGDRVVGFAAGYDEKVNNSAEGGFQEYTVLRTNLTAKIPDSMAFEKAAVIPLGLGTAASGMFQKDQLGLQLPSVNPKPTGQTLIVWGGSTSVGCNAIQLGVAAGYEVFTTCSPKNFDLCTGLGASRVFDYKSPTVVADMIAALQGKKVAGALTIGDGAAVACQSILDNSEGNKFISMATYPLPQGDPEKQGLLKTAFTFGTWMASFKAKGLLKGIKSNFIFGCSFIHTEVAAAVFVDFLPKALESGAFVPAPEPYVAGEGIEKIQAALDYQRKGVSALKVVISL